MQTLNDGSSLTFIVSYHFSRETNINDVDDEWEYKFNAVQWKKLIKLTWILRHKIQNLES